MEQLLQNFHLFRDAFIATVVIATVLSFLSVHVILRRVVFVGIALSEMSALGIAMSFFLERFAWTEPGTLLGFTREHLAMGAIFNFIGLAFLTPPESRRLSREARIGICIAAAGALAILLVSTSAHGMDEIRALMSHDPLFVRHDDLNILILSMIPALGILILFFRRFLIVGHDREMAISVGVNALHWDVLFYLLLGLAVAMAIHLSGVLFAIGYLVLPGAAALGLGRSPWQIFIYATLIGFLSSFSGFVISVQYDTPPGPTTVTVAFAVFLMIQFSRWLFTRLRGH